MDMLVIKDGFVVPFHAQPTSIAQVLLQPSPEPIWSVAGAVSHLQDLEDLNSSISNLRNSDLEDLFRPIWQKWGNRIKEDTEGWDGSSQAAWPT